MSPSFWSFWESLACHVWYLGSGFAHLIHSQRFKKVLLVHSIKCNEAQFKCCGVGSNLHESF